MAVSDIKVAVVGAGWIATHGHLPGHQNAGARLVAIADVAPGLAEKIGAEYGVERAYTDWQEMIAEEQPDVVSVCVPNAFHHEVVTTALESGAHVLCEKPLATSVAEAVSMYDTARKAGRYLMAEQNLRFRPVNEAIMARIETGEFGRIYHADAVYVRRLGIPSWGSFTKRRFSAGGAMLDIGVHVIDCAMWFMGGAVPVEVSAQTGAFFGTRQEIADARRNAWDPREFDVEDFASAFIRLEDGATISVQACWASHIEADREYVQVMGTDAGAINDPGTIFKFVDGEKVNEILDVPHSTGWLETVAHFLRVVDGQEPMRIQPQETLNVQRVIDACYKSAKLGRAVRLDDRTRRQALTQTDRVTRR